MSYEVPLVQDRLYAVRSMLTLLYSFLDEQLTGEMDGSRHPGRHRKSRRRERRRSMKNCNSPIEAPDYRTEEGNHWIRRKNFHAVGRSL